MLMRLALSAVLLIAGTVGFVALKKIRLSKAAHMAGTDPLLESTLIGVPTILYFTTQDCMTCKYAQGPALEQLKSELGENINIVKVDAAEDRDAADRWKIRTVPTTYVLDSAGVPVEVNQGATETSRLRAQVASAS